jgi:hypothetical protein
LSGARAHLNQALGFEDFDGADVALGDSASLAKEWQYPARLTSLPPSDRELEPDTGIEIVARHFSFAGVSPLSTNSSGVGRRIWFWRKNAAAICSG